LTGWYERGFAGEPFDVALRYRIVRVWQVPAEQWLSGGLGLVPLAPLGAVREEELPAVIGQMKQRLDAEPSPNRRADLWWAAYFLMGTCYEPPLIERLLRGVLAMKESVTYQAVLSEGKAEGVREVLLMLGRDQFGAPSAEVRAALDAITDVNRLQELAGHLKHAASWHDLLGLPAPRRHSNRRKRSS
jgi:predicted transposase YdaD